MGHVQSTSTSMRRAQLVVLAQLARIVVPEARTTRTDSTAVAGDAHAPGYTLVELGVRPSYLVPGEAALGPVRHRVQRPARHVPHVTLEPVALARRLLLLVAPHHARVDVDGERICGVSFLRAGSLLELSRGVAFGFTTFRAPAVFEVTAKESAQRCALCRGHLYPGGRAVRCRCGALLHAGWARPFGAHELPHRCADLGDCPDCAAELPRDAGHEWLPGDPVAPRVGGDTRRVASVLGQHLGELGVESRKDVRAVGRSAR